MPIKSEHHKQIVDFLDNYGPAKAIGIHSKGVDGLQAEHKGSLDHSDIKAMHELSTLTSAKLALKPKGKTIVITFS